MKTLSIIFACALVALASCTKSKEAHPEVGDGNNEIVTVGIDNVHIKYIRNDISSLQKVMFHYGLTDDQQFDAAEMTKKSDCFELTLNSLESDTLYSYYYEVFPYSGNAYQTLQKTFHTQYVDTVQPTPPVVVPTGAINGLFTIDSLGHKVYFSQGNLQYQASTNTWRFAEHQWDCVGEANANISPTYDGWIDLFGWGTSGWNNGNLYYQPYDYDNNIDENIGYGYGPTDGINYTYDLNEDYANADWGIYNAISNGGNTPNQWRTLDELEYTGNNGEWFYVFEKRATPSGIRYAKAIVNGVNGIVLLSDNWSPTIYSLNNPNVHDAPYTINEISAENWTIMEANGAVFLPAAGRRYGTSLLGIGNDGFYRSVSCRSHVDQSMCVYFTNTLTATVCFTDRYDGESVRLVQDANK